VSRLGRATLEAAAALRELEDLDVERRIAGLEALRELWAITCEAGDPAYFAKLADHLDRDHQLGAAAGLYQQRTGIELLDLHTEASHSQPRR
jgi:hypothetical protein